MNKDLIDFYNEEYRKVEKEIQELNEVNKKSPKRIARLVEIEYILDGLNASQELQRLRKENSDLKYRLVKEGIDIYEWQENINYSKLTGSTKVSERLKLINEFNKDPEKKLFLISLKAGGTGLNLTSASMVIHFDPWFNPAVENQASDRAHRIGQKNVVNIIKLISKDTVEEKVIAMQENKKELIEDIINSNLESSTALKKLSRDEIIDLFANI